ncbi:hypothetical protein Tco_1522734 [Tanacetum coccineum]
MTPNPAVSKGESSVQQKSTVIRLSLLSRKVGIVREYLAAEEIEKMVEGTENVDVDQFVNSILNSQNDPGTRLDPGSYIESLEVEITVVIQPVNVIEEKDESTEDDYELRRRVKGKHVEEEILGIDDSHVNEATKTTVPVYVAMGLLMEKSRMQTKVAQMVAGVIQREHENLLAESSANRPRWKSGDIMDSHPEGFRRIVLKSQKISGAWNCCHWRICVWKADKRDQYDDELPAEIVSQELVKEMSETVDEAKLRKVVGELGHEHKFVTKIIVRRANERISSITEPGYKNLKNDNKDMYLLCVNGKVDDYAVTGLLWSLSVFIRSTVIWERVHHFQLDVESYQQNVNLTAPTITFPGIEKKKMFSIITEPIHGIMYKNSKK